MSLSLLCLLSFSQLDIQGYWEYRAAMDRNEGLAFSQRPEFQTRFEYYQSNFLWASEVRYRHDYNEDLGVEEDLDLREFYVSLPLEENHQLRVGQRILIWGVFDEFSANDYLNAEDYSYFLTDRRADRKIGNAMLEWVTLFDSGQQQLSFVFLPVFRADQIPPSGSPWANSIQAPSYIEGSREFAPENNQYAARYLATGVAGDFSLYLYHGFDHQAAFELNNQLVAHYERYTAGGTSVSLPVDDHIIKTEFSLRSSSARELKSGELLKSPQIRANLGWESFSLSPIWFELDLFLSGYLKREAEAIRDNWSSIFLIQTRTSWLQDDLEMEFRYAFDLQHPGHFIHGDLGYRLLPALKMSVGTYLFAGDMEGNFGQYRTNDHVYFQTRCSF